MPWARCLGHTNTSAFLSVIIYLHYFETESSFNFISQRIPSHTALRSHKSPLTHPDYPSSQPEWYSTQREGPPHFFPGGPPKLLSWCSANTAGVLWYQPWSQITTGTGGRNRRKETERVLDMYTESFLNHFIQFPKSSLQVLYNLLPEPCWKKSYSYFCTWESKASFTAKKGNNSSLWWF